MNKEDLEKFTKWYKSAKKCNPVEPDAVALTTISDGQKPSTRMVLLKAFDERGFVFYTNLNSRKGEHIKHNTKVGMCFDWRSDDGHIVTIKGRAVAVPEVDADAYFDSRYLFSRIGAWASKQSQITPHKYYLILRVWYYLLKYIANFMKISRPKFWSGFRVEPTEVSFVSRSS